MSADPARPVPAARYVADKHNHRVQRWELLRMGWRMSSDTSSSKADMLRGRAEVAEARANKAQEQLARDKSWIDELRSVASAMLTAPRPHGGEVEKAKRVGRWAPPGKRR